MFLENVFIAAEQVIILYVIVAVGFVADRTGIYTEKTARLCTDLLFYIITPAKIVQSFVHMEYDRATAQGFFIALGCGLLLHSISALISTVAFNKSPVERGAIFKYACAYGNCGYMALPLANAVVGEQGVFFCSAVIISFQMFAFTHGIWLMSKSSEKKQKFNFKKILLNQGTISVAIGLPIFLLSLNLPKIIVAPLDYIANLNTPVAMLIFGTYISQTKFKTMFKEWRIGAVALIKLIILPLIMLGIYKLLGLSGALMTSLAISASSPPANNTVMFAAKYDKDTGLSSQTVALVSFVSILTMPLMIGLAVIS